MRVAIGSDHAGFALKEALSRGTRLFIWMESQISLFDLGKSISSPRPTRIEEPARAGAVKDWRFSATRTGLDP
jgi:hypothetical protein